MSENEKEVITDSETSEEVETDESIDESDESTEEVKEDKPKLTDEEKLARIEGQRKRLLKKMGREEKSEKEPKVEPKSTTGKLNETQLDYLDLKGITESEDVDIIQEVIKKTGMTVREALKDEWVEGKLKANKEKRELLDATPSSTKRGKGSADAYATAKAEYERTGKLPADFELRSRIVNEKHNETNPSVPPWRR